MLRSLRQLSSGLSWRRLRDKFRGIDQRQLQQQLDTHKLYLYLSLHEQCKATGGLPPKYAVHAIQQVSALSYEQQQLRVQQLLQQQLLSIAAALHITLTQAGDPTRSAAALLQAAQQPDQDATPVDVDSLATAAPPAAAVEAGTPPCTASTPSTHATSGGAGRLSQVDVAVGLRQRLGYALSVRLSRIAHAEAGRGLFLEGAVPPGTLLALFPGLVYHREHYRRMPGYPKVDRGNPYLVARFDGGVVDSLPWGSGDAALDGACDAQQHHAEWARKSSDHGAQHERKHAQSLPPRSRRGGLLRRMVEASDGPRRSPPPTSWVRASTAEAAALELLEGRHPLALAHFANHPALGTAPNAMLAPFSVAPWLQGSSRRGGALAESARDNGVAGNEQQQQQQLPAWVRAYLPNIPYSLHADVMPPGELLTQPVNGIGLVALSALCDGEEIMFDYRLSPGLGRPPWYQPVDAQQQDRRWA